MQIGSTNAQSSPLPSPFLSFSLVSIIMITVQKVGSRLHNDENCEALPGTDELNVFFFLQLTGSLPLHQQMAANANRATVTGT